MYGVRMRVSQSHVKPKAFREFCINSSNELKKLFECVGVTFHSSNFVCFFLRIFPCFFVSTRQVPTMTTILTVKVQGDGGIAFSQFVLGRDLVFTGILNGNAFDFKGREVLNAIFVDGKLK